MEETSNLNAPVTPSMSDVDDGEEVVSHKIKMQVLLSDCCAFLHVLL